MARGSLTSLSLGRPACKAGTTQPAVLGGTVRAGRGPQPTWASATVHSPVPGRLPFRTRTVLSSPSSFLFLFLFYFLVAVLTKR